MQKQIVTEAPQRFSVLGLPVHLLDDYPGWLISRLHRRQGGHVVTLNAEMTVQAEENANLARAIAQAELVIPDGSGVVLYLRLQGQQVQRCPGIELAESLLRQVGKMGRSCPVFFYGGAPGIPEIAAKEWQRQVPGLVCAGVSHGYLSPQEEEQLLKTLADLQPRLILVGLGVPRQELWIAQNRHLCPNSTWIGVGGSLDIWAGVKSRAPAWFRNNHLEWFYRLYKEPWRWRRMLALPLFAWRALVRS